MQSASTIVNVLAPVGVLFAHLSEEDYREALDSEAWGSVRAAALCVWGDDAECDALLSRLEPLDWSSRRAFQNEILVAGMPLAAMPVESLYKPWSVASGNSFGACRGLYLGDAARHVRAIYDSLNIEVPVGFEAMPDHLSLLLDLLALYLEAGNDAAAADLATDHLDWLAAYDEVLQDRAKRASEAPALDGDKRACVLAGIAQTRTLIALVDRIVRDIRNTSPREAMFDRGISVNVDHRYTEQEERCS